MRAILNMCAAEKRIEKYVNKKSDKIERRNREIQNKSSSLQHPPLIQ